jgi:uncharacterized small protein (DUF1192 family)
MRRKWLSNRGETQPLERLRPQQIAALQTEVSGVHRELGVDEAGAHRPLGETDHLCAGRSPTDRATLHNMIALDENLSRRSQGIGKTVERIAACQNEHAHLRASLRRYPSDHSAQALLGARVRRQSEDATRGE